MAKSADFEFRALPANRIITKRQTAPWEPLDRLIDLSRLDIYVIPR